MSRWFRLYDDTINDPKVIKLPEVTRWHWVALLCVSSKNEGILPALDDVAIQLRVTPAKATEIIAALVKANLIDKTESGFAPHNWDGRQYKSDTSNERVKRYRQRKCNVTETVTGTVTDGVTVTPCSVSVSDSVSISSSKKENEQKITSFSDPPDFDEFWAYWPNKVGKPAAVKAYHAAIKRGAKPSDMIDGIENYIRDKPPDRPWLNPATFLNQDRWKDQPARVSPIAKPLTEFQRKQQETTDVLSELRNTRNGNRGSGALDRLLPDHHGERPEGLRSGTGQALLELSRASSRGGH